MAPAMTPMVRMAPSEAVAGTSRRIAAASSMTPEPIRPQGSTPLTPTKRPTAVKI